MKHVLYLGTDPENYRHIRRLVHCPMIKIIPLQIPQHIRDDFADYTHILMTSKNAVTIFLDQFEMGNKQLIAIGTSTASKLVQAGYPPHFVAQDETQEGVIELLKTLDLHDAYIFYPRSSQARKKLRNYMIERGIRHQICDLYETVFQKPEPLPDLSTVKEIIFTSPSTVKSFFSVFGRVPPEIKLTCIGPITEEELKQFSNDV